QWAEPLLEPAKLVVLGFERGVGIVEVCPARVDESPRYRGAHRPPARIAASYAGQTRLPLACALRFSPRLGECATCRYAAIEIGSVAPLTTSDRRPVQQRHQQDHDEHEAEHT